MVADALNGLYVPEGIEAITRQSHQSDVRCLAENTDIVQVLSPSVELRDAFKAILSGLVQNERSR